WRWRKKVSGGLFLALALVGFGVIALFALIDNDDLRNTLGPVAVICCIALLIAWFIVTIIVQSKAIAATEITDESIYLKNVCERFVESLEGTREADPERFKMHIRTRAKSSSSGALVLGAVLIAFLLIVVLVAIGNIGKEAMRQQALQPGAELTEVV